MFGIQVYKYSSPTLRSLDLTLTFPAGAEDKSFAMQVIAKCLSQTIWLHDEDVASLKTIEKCFSPLSLDVRPLSEWVQLRIDAKASPRSLRTFCNMSLGASLLAGIDDFIATTRKTNAFYKQLEQVQKELCSPESDTLLNGTDSFKIVSHFGQIKKQVVGIVSNSGATAEIIDESEGLRFINSKFGMVLRHLGLIVHKTLDRELLAIFKNLTQKDVEQPDKHLTQLQSMLQNLTSALPTSDIAAPFGTEDDVHRWARGNVLRQLLAGSLNVLAVLRFGDKSSVAAAELKTFADLISHVETADDFKEEYVRLSHGIHQEFSGAAAWPEVRSCGLVVLSDLSSSLWSAAVEQKEWVSMWWAYSALQSKSLDEGDIEDVLFCKEVLPQV